MPIVFFRRRADRVAMKGTLDTLLFEPDAERFSMVWRATLKLQRDIFEVPQAAIGRMFARLVAGGPCRQELQVSGHNRA